MARIRKIKPASGLEIEMGSGNVYRDLGFKNAEAMLARARSKRYSEGPCTLTARANSPAVRGPLVK